MIASERAIEHIEKKREKNEENGGLGPGLDKENEKKHRCNSGQGEKIRSDFEFAKNKGNRPKNFIALLGGFFVDFFLPGVHKGIIPGICEDAQTIILVCFIILILSPSRRDPAHKDSWWQDKWYPNLPTGRQVLRIIMKLLFIFLRICFWSYF